MNVSGYGYNVVGQQPQGGGYHGLNSGDYVNGQYKSPFDPSNFFTAPGQNQGVFDPSGSAKSAWQAQQAALQAQQKQQQQGQQPGGYNQLPTYGPPNASPAGQGTVAPGMGGSVAGGPTSNLFSLFPTSTGYTGTAGQNQLLQQYEARLNSPDYSKIGLAGIPGIDIPGIGNGGGGSQSGALQNTGIQAANNTQYNPLTPYGGSGTQYSPYQQGPGGGTMQPQGFYY